MIQTMIRTVDGVQIHYRPGTTDENCIREIFDRRSYRRASIGFDVEAGETWMDLGANIGVFGAYCKSKGAITESYEPLRDNFNLLRLNTIGVCVQACVTHFKEPHLDMWVSRRKGNYYRGTVLPQTGAMQPIPVRVKNICVESLLNQTYDGIKMDIEGAEFGLLDNKWLPRCNKLCFEYHLSRDRSVKRLAARVLWLQERFKTVVLHSETRGILAAGKDNKGWQDRVVFCMGAK